MNIYVISKNDFPWRVMSSELRAQELINALNSEERLKDLAGQRRVFYHLTCLELDED